MKPPRGQRPIWTLLAAAALALLGYQADQHHPALPLATGPTAPAPQASLTPGATASAPPDTPPARAPAQPSTAPPPGSTGSAPSAVAISARTPTSRPTPSTAGSPTPAPSSPPPSPSPTPSPQPPAVAVTVAVTPARSTFPLAARAALVVPTGPPDPPAFPRLTAAVDLLGLHAAISLP